MSSRAVLPFWLLINSSSFSNFSNRAFGLSFNWTYVHNLSLCSSVTPFWMSSFLTSAHSSLSNLSTEEHTVLNISSLIFDILIIASNNNLWLTFILNPPIGNWVNISTTTLSTSVSGIILP